MKTQRLANSSHPRPKKSGAWWQVPCPAFGGDGPDPAIRDAEVGGLILTCHSLTCNYREIVEATERLRPSLLGTGRGNRARGSPTAKQGRCGPVMP